MGLVEGRISCFSQVAAGAVVSSICDGATGNSLMLPLGSQVSFRAVRGAEGLLASHCWGIRPHLALRGESHGVSRVGEGSFAFFSSCNGDLTEPPHVALQEVRLASSCQRHLGISLESLEERVGLISKLRWETGSFPVATAGISGFLPGLQQGVRPHLELRHGIRFPLEL